MAESGLGVLRQGRKWLGGPRSGSEMVERPSGRAVIGREALRQVRKWSGGPLAWPEVVAGPLAGPKVIGGPAAWPEVVEVPFGRAKRGQRTLQQGRK